MSDLDRIAERIGECIAELTGNTFLPADSLTEVTVEPAGWITTVVELQRLRDWVTGLSEAHKQ